MLKYAAILLVKIINFSFLLLPHPWHLYEQLHLAAVPGQGVGKVHKSVFEIIGKVPLSGERKDATFTLRHIVSECDMILAIFLDF